MKKWFKLLAALLVTASVTSCGVNGSGKPSSGNTSENGGSSEGGENCGTCTGTEIDLDAINEYFYTNDHWADMTGPSGNGNKVTLIPFTHINGPKAEWNFFAIVNFEYGFMNYYKYQVTYLSCTCRAQEVNYWQTAYVELSIPASGDINDVQLISLSFENDDGKKGEGHYIAGFWGDSGTNGHDIEGSGVYYEDIRDGFIPYLVGKTYGEVSSFDGYTDPNTGVSYDDTVWGIDPNDFETDMKDVLFQGDHQVTLDDFNGASVSTNNILRMILSIMEYHGNNNI